MVRDGIYFALGLGVAAIVLGWLAGPGFALIPIPFAAFFLWFFRDPERIVPTAPGSIVSPADGKVTAAGLVEVKGIQWQRISIFLNVFDVHVNRSPIAGVIREIEYRRGKFGNAMGAVSAESNEQNVVTVEGEGMTVIFKQIAGLLARRIVFTPKPGDYLYRGQRIGMIKFGSRVDVLLPPDAVLQVRLGDHVAGGSTLIAMGAKNVVPEMALASQISQAPVDGGMI